MSGTRLEGRRVLIVGGSVGIGKATGVAIAAEGGRVALGGLDAIVYAPGITLFGRIAELDATESRRSFDVNVVGATLVTRAAVPHLSETRGKVVYFPSIAIDDRPPRYGMASYIASKVALESVSQAWQSEFPDRGFTTIAIGDTQSEKADVVSEEVLQEYVPRWVVAGLMPAENVAAQKRRAEA